MIPKKKSSSPAAPEATTKKRATQTTETPSTETPSTETVSGQGPETLLAGAVQVLPSKGKRRSHPSTNRDESDSNPQPADGKAAKKKAAPKKTKARRLKGEPKEDLVVFAFRLTAAEREAIHKAAGAAKASRFVRTLAVAAADRDEAKVRELVKSAGTTS